MGKLIQGVNDLETWCKQNNRQDLLDEWNYEKNDDLTPQQVSYGSKQKVWWVCSQGHSFEQKPNSRTGDICCCPYCSGRKVLQGYNDLETICPELIQEWAYDENNSLTPKMVTKSCTKKVYWRCSKDHLYIATIANRTNGSGCPYCAGNKVLKGFNDLATTHPNLLSFWDYDKNVELTPQQVSKCSTKKVWWTCEKGHSYLQQINNKTSLGQGCPICKGTQVLQGYNDLATTHPYLLPYWDTVKNVKITPFTISKGSHTKVWWLCSNGHSYQQSVLNKVNEGGCPYCSGSKTERLLYDLLKEKGISFKAEKKFDSTPKYEVQYYPYDIYINNHRLIIETDGIQHFEDIPFFSNVSFEIRVRRDNVKNEFCLDRPTPIPILRIPYTYNPDTEKDKIEKLVMDFIETRKVPQEILDFYKPYKESIGSNYYDIATKMNEIKWNGYE